MEREILNCAECPFCDSCSPTLDEILEMHSCDYLLDFDLDIGSGEDDVAEIYWKGMSYRRYTQRGIDFSYSEYSDGDWNWE